MVVEGGRCIGSQVVAHVEGDWWVAVEVAAKSVVVAEPKSYSLSSLECLLARELLPAAEWLEAEEWREGKYICRHKDRSCRRGGNCIRDSRFCTRGCQRIAACVDDGWVVYSWSWDTFVGVRPSPFSIGGVARGGCRGTSCVPTHNVASACIVGSWAYELCLSKTFRWVKVVWQLAQV